MAQLGEFEVGETIYWPGPQNSVAGSGVDGGAVDYFIRLCGAGAAVAPVANGSMTLLSEATYPDGCYEGSWDSTGATPGQYSIFLKGDPVGDDSISPVAPHVFTLRAVGLSVTGKIGTPVALDGGAATLSGMGTKMADDNGGVDFDATTDSQNAIAASLSGLAVTGSPVNTPAESYTLTTGTQSSGTYASTAALDGVNHEHTDDAGAMDLYYQFAIGGDGVPTSVTMTGYLNGNNDDLEVYAYNWGTTSWNRIGTLEGKNGASNDVHQYNLYTSHVGTGVNIGKVRIRFTDGAFTLSNATLAIDQIFCSYTIVRRAVGYADGAIWVDTNASNTNTESFVDGVADNPVSTWAAALTLSGNLNITRFHIINGSTITLSGNSDGYTLLGQAWTLVLNGQSCSAAYFEGAGASGICTGAANPVFVDCHFGNTTLPSSHLSWCGFEGTITLGSTGDFFFDRCHSGVAGTATPYLDFGTAIGNTNVNFRGYSGGIEIQNMGGSGTDLMSLEGHGQLVINANCSGGVIAIRGHFIVTDNASGVVTLSDNARYDTAQIRDSILDDATRFSGADIAAILADTGTTIPTQIAALNNLSVADVGTALTDYDAATGANVTASTTTIVAAIDALNNPTAAAIADAVLDEGLSDHETAGTTAAALAVLWNDWNFPTASSWIVYKSDGSTVFKTWTLAGDGTTNFSRTTA